MRRLEADLFPWIGARPTDAINAPELLQALRRIQARGALETAHRALQTCSQIFRYAVATGRAIRDPAADLRGALPPVRVQHFPAITEPTAIGRLLCDLNGYQGSFVTRCALQLAPRLFVRPGELRKAEWLEFNLDAAEWRIPAAKMKMRQEHIVPLSRQAVAILRELQPLTGQGRYLFPGLRTADRPMSENTINGALRRLGYEQVQTTRHGFRSMASTLLNEQGWRSDVIERQLAHGERNKIRACYNRAEHLPERRQMMQAWSVDINERPIATGWLTFSIINEKKRRGRPPEFSEKLKKFLIYVWNIYADDSMKDSVAELEKKMGYKDNNGRSVKRIKKEMNKLILL